MDEVACLRALQAVRDHGTVTAAASVLRVSPSALSQQLKRLSRAAGRELTAASGRRIVLTPAAHTLLEDALPLVEGLERALRGHTATGDGSAAGETVVGHVRIAAFTTGVRAHVAPALAQLHHDHPGLSWSLLETDPDRAMTALAAGAVDLALVHHWRGRPSTVHPDLTVTGAHHDPAEVICRRDDPLLLDAPVSVDALADRRWVSTGAGSVCHDWLLHMFARRGYRPSIIAELDDLTLHLELVHHGLALALVPQMGRAPLHEDLTTLPFDDTPARIVSIATRTNQNHDPAITLLRTTLLTGLDPSRPNRD